MLKRLFAGLLALCCAAALAAVDINKADQAALESIKGIGPALSGKLLDERKKGPYKDWGDLIDRVPGVGPGNALRLSDAGLTVGGSSYSAAAKADKPVPKTKPAATASK